MAMERQHRPIDKEFEECYYTGVLDISGRNLRMFPNIGDDIYDPLELFTGSEFGLVVGGKWAWPSIKIIIKIILMVNENI